MEQGVRGAKQECLTTEIVVFEVNILYTHSVDFRTLEVQVTVAGKAGWLVLELLQELPDDI